MREPRRAGVGTSHCRLTFVLIVVGLSCYINLASSSPAWPIFMKRNVQALARDGLLRNSGANLGYEYKRSISTLAKNGQLPTFRAPEDNADEEDTDESQSRNLAAVASLRGYAKRTTGTLARNGVKAGKRAYEDKRNIGSLARNGYLKSDANVQKRENALEDEYYYPFYQNPIPPVSEMDYPLDYNELYDLQQSMHPDELPPISEWYDKRNIAALLRQDAYNVLRNNPNYRTLPMPNGNDDEFDQVDKRQSVGLPNHGLYRKMIPAAQAKRYTFAFPEPAGGNNEAEYDDMAEKTEKRSVGSIPMTRISELGNISLIPKVSHKPIQTTPTYRRRQYLLTRTQPAEGEADQ